MDERAQYRVFVEGAITVGDHPEFRVVARVGGRERVTQHRYTSFTELHSRLDAGSRFPVRKLWRHSDAALRERAAALERYLQESLRTGDAARLSVVDAFLGGLQAEHQAMTEEQPES